MFPLLLLVVVVLFA